jgi:hypothetical protein
MRSERRLRRRAGVLGAGVLVVGALVGCSAAGPAPAPAPTFEHAVPAVNRDVAQQQMVDAVEAATGRLGGTWQPRTGPDYLEDCRLPDGDQGAKWRYLVTRSSTGDIAGDVAATEARWQHQGMTIDHWGTTADRPTIVGRGGGRTDSIRLTVADGQYAVQALSLCFPGDADEDL